VDDFYKLVEKMDHETAAQMSREKLKRKGKIEFDSLIVRYWIRKRLTMRVRVRTLVVRDR